VGTLHTLHRLRQATRRESDAVLRRAQAERDAQVQRLDALRNQMETARAGVDPSDPAAMASWHAWRLRAEIEQRREIARLAQRERDLEAASRVHQKNVRDELSLERVIEAHEEEARIEAARKDTLALDEVGGRRRIE
jgi:hypothetical protein